MVDKLNKASEVEGGFRCRTCGDTKLIEVMTDVTVSSECTLSADGVEYGEQTNEDGEVAYYQCDNGHPVVNDRLEAVTTEDELVALFAGKQ